MSSSQNLGSHGSSSKILMSSELTSRTSQAFLLQRSVLIFVKLMQHVRASGMSCQHNSVRQKQLVSRMEQQSTTIPTLQTSKIGMSLIPSIATSKSRSCLKDFMVASGLKQREELVFPKELTSRFVVMRSIQFHPRPLTLCYLTSDSKTKSSMDKTLFIKTQHRTEVSF